jgi:hypothetical protein
VIVSWIGVGYLNCVCCNNLFPHRLRNIKKVQTSCNETTLKGSISHPLHLGIVSWNIGWFGWLVCSCCSHLEHMAPVKRFVSLQFLNLRHSVGLLGRVISPSQGRYVTQTQNKHKQTSMPRVGFEPTIPAFKRAQTFHALDRAATVIGLEYRAYSKFHSCTSWPQQKVVIFSETSPSIVTEFCLFLESSS